LLLSFHYLYLEVLGFLYHRSMKKDQALEFRIFFSLKVLFRFHKFPTVELSD
jgi:hypothetical protein